MASKRLVGITIGQSPRFDITNDIKKYLSTNITLIEYGALDHLTFEEVIDMLKPQPGREVLVSRMRDGTEVMLDGDQIPGLVQNCVDQAENEGVDGIIIMCTGSFFEIKHNIPLIIPQALLHSTIKNVAHGKKVGIITPDQSQVEQVIGWWRESGVDTEVVAGSPYTTMDSITYAARQLKSKDLSLICLDCMGYTIEMKNKVSEITKKPVILPRTLVARIADELFGG